MGRRGLLNTGVCRAMGGTRVNLKRRWWYEEDAVETRLERISEEGRTQRIRVENKDFSTHRFAAPPMHIIQM